MKRSKNYQESLKLVDKTKLYDTKEAVEAVYARQELIDAAVELAASDMANMSVSKEELIAEAQKLTNEELLHFIEE